MEEVQDVIFLLLSSGSKEVHHIIVFHYVYLRLPFFQDNVKQSESSKDTPVLLQQSSSALPSSSLHLEELLTPKVAPATPSYDTESTATTIIGSTIAFNPQANGHVSSSVIFIPPSNSGQVQASDPMVGVEERSHFEPFPTKEPEVLISVLDTA